MVVVVVVVVVVLLLLLLLLLLFCCCCCIYLFILSRKPNRNLVYSKGAYQRRKKEKERLEYNTK